MSLRSFFAAILSRTDGVSAHESARISYGSEPYGAADSVTIQERIEAVTSYNVKYLLRYVLGSKVFNTLAERDYPNAFRKALPTTRAQIIEHVRSAGIPLSIARYAKPDGSGQWIHQHDSGSWIVSDVDERYFRHDTEFATKWEAEKAVIDKTIHSYCAFWADTDTGERSGT